MSWRAERWQATEQGTPQGAGISPLLANILLHYALDNWVAKRMREGAFGEMFIVRYADDFVMGFKHERAGQAMLTALKERLGKFGLELHEDKTRLIEFGRYAAERRAQRGERRPGTFAFLGFTHCCSQSRDGRFVVKRKTQRKRLARKLKAVRAEAKRRLHAPVAVQHQWLSQVLRGHYACFGLPCNLPALKSFWHEAKRIWFRVLKRRSRPSPIPGSPHRRLRSNLQEEPSAGRPHARTCEGATEGSSCSAASCTGTAVANRSSLPPM